MEIFSVETIKIQGYILNEKLCFDICLKPNATIVDLTLKGLPLHDTFCLVDTSQKLDQELCKTNRACAEFAIEFFTPLNLVDRVREMQKQGYEKIFIGSTDKINDEHLKTKISTLNIQNLSDKEWVDLYVSISGTGNKNATQDYFETFSTTIKNFRAEFTFANGFVNNVNPNVNPHELFARICYKDKVDGN